MVQGMSSVSNSDPSTVVTNGTDAIGWRIGIIVARSLTRLAILFVVLVIPYLKVHHAREFHLFLNTRSAGIHLFMNHTDVMLVNNHVSTHRDKPWFSVEIRDDDPMEYGLRMNDYDPLSGPALGMFNLDYRDDEITTWKGTIVSYTATPKREISVSTIANVWLVCLILILSWYVDGRRLLRWFADSED